MWKVYQHENLLLSWVEQLNAAGFSSADLALQNVTYSMQGTQRVAAVSGT